MLVSQQCGTLLEAQTADGIRLHGFATFPDETSIDANRSSDDRCRHSGKRLWILVHGVSGNFFGSSLLNEIARVLVAEGDSVLRINTRGRDSIVFHATSRFVKRGGSAFESISESLEDLSAWYTCAQDLGFSKIALAGHSLGALKVLLFAHAASTSQPRTLDAVLALSPPRFSSSQLGQGDRGEEYLRNLQEAESHCALGRFEQLMKVSFPFPMLISAATFVDKYGAHDRYDYLPWLSEMVPRTLVCFGSKEVGELADDSIETQSAEVLDQSKRGKACFEGADRSIQELESQNPRLTTRCIVGADHHYTGKLDALGDQVRQWLGQPVPGDQGNGSVFLSR